MEERQIWCCGASGWARVIGWFQAFVFGLMTISSLLFIIGSIWERNNIDRFVTADGKPLSPQRIHALKDEVDYDIGGFVMILITSLGGYAMAMILLRGSHSRNPRLLCAWMIYTVLSVIVWTVQTITLYVIAPSKGGTGTTIFTLLGGFLTQGFFLWVVDIHKKEIEASGGAFKKLHNIPDPGFSYH